MRYITILDQVWPSNSLNNSERVEVCLFCTCSCIFMKIFFSFFPNIGCEDCQTAKSENCPEHPAVIIPDRRLLSFARQTLPTNFTLAVTAQREHSLMCKKAIKIRSRFGPLLGKEVKVDNGVDPQKYLFRVSHPLWQYNHSAAKIKWWHMLCYYGMEEKPSSGKSSHVKS